ncbi:MAG: DEAD/DEAH box helicase [Cyanobacteria bacterium]|nr:DEAD/DEAH box helicase [Cyanobacteriota bacterium]
MLESFSRQLDFPLDPFQKEAMSYIEQGSSVVVCAPTGSGKTVIAEFAATLALEKGLKLFYTTPLKALSNQKFFDFTRQFGEANVGLLTGDLTLNRDARILVMTTEIFRNMLYGESMPSHAGFVVLDECHYMNDADRGTVWEESIIYCPEHMQLIALSATVANDHELTDWINEVHRDTRLVHSDFRPVPLRFSYYNREHLLPLFEAPGKLNKKLKGDFRGNRFSKKIRDFSPNHLIEIMHEREMLPAIIFTFSRRDCGRYLQDTKRLSLLNPQERQQIQAVIQDYTDRYPFLANDPSIEAIRNGFAAHHAGLLPGLKLLVETLFQQGLIKAVFATETLAAGINMPARSTVITSLSKRTNEGHRILRASEFLQMSGRAGRRGMDTVGYVVINSSRFEGAHDAAMLATSQADALNSQFTPNYGMVLNLLQSHSLSEAEFLISKSFGQFTAARRLQPIKDELNDVESAVQEYQQFQCPAGVEDAAFQSYLKTRDHWVETQRFVRDLKQQLKRYGNHGAVRRQMAHEEAKRDSFEKSLLPSPCHRCELLNKHRKLFERGKRMLKHQKRLKVIYENEQDWYWKEFMRIYAVLSEAGQLSTDNKPTDAGKMTAQIRTENELFVSQLVVQGVFDELSPSVFAGTVAALVTDTTRESIFSKVPPSPECRQAFHQIERTMRQLQHLQDKHRVSVPLVFNPIASGLVEAWVQELAWDQLITLTNLDQGDLVRIFRRTADLLRQFSRLNAIPSPLAQKARQALKTLDRDPVREVSLVASLAQDEVLQEEVKEVLQEETLIADSPLPQSE